MTITPGQYLKLRRCAAGLSVADVAARIGTQPRLAEHARVELIELIEADAAPARFDTIMVLGNVFPFDYGILGKLVNISLGADWPAPRICRICGCSDQDPCVMYGRFHCAWFSEDLCTRCNGQPGAVPIEAAA
jgi:hypothetical protein